jgi:heterodisulfide reductase subunit A
MTDEKKNSDSRAEHEKVGIYICYCGGNISDHVDVEAVRDRVEKLPGFPWRGPTCSCARTRARN